MKVKMKNYVTHYRLGYYISKFIFGEEHWDRHIDTIEGIPGFRLIESVYEKYFKFIENRRVKVEINEWDVISLDDTLTQIILPALEMFKKQYKNSGFAGAPITDWDDVPEHLRPGKDELEKILAATERGDHYTDSNYFARWVYIIDTMIVSFKLQSRYEPYEMTQMQKDKVDEGLKLFGKYYNNLWL